MILDSRFYVPGTLDSGRDLPDRRALSEPVGRQLCPTRPSRDSTRKSLRRKTQDVIRSFLLI